MIQIAISGVGELERLEADLVESLIVDAEGLVRVLNQLMDRKRGIVWFNDRVGYLNKAN